MHGVITGAILGMGALALMNAVRGVRAWQTSERRPPVWAISVSVALQVVLGLAAIVFGIWFALYGG